MIFGKQDRTITYLTRYKYSASIFKRINVFSNTNNRRKAVQVLDLTIRENTVEESNKNKMYGFFFTKQTALNYLQISGHFRDGGSTIYSCSYSCSVHTLKNSTCMIFLRYQSVACNPCSLQFLTMASISAP